MAVQCSLSLLEHLPPHHTTQSHIFIMSCQIRKHEGSLQKTDPGPDSSSIPFDFLCYPFLCFAFHLAFLFLSFFLSLRICSKVVHSRQILSISRISTPGISRSKFLYFPSLILSYLLSLYLAVDVQFNAIFQSQQANMSNTLLNHHSIHVAL